MIPEGAFRIVVLRRRTVKKLSDGGRRGARWRCRLDVHHRGTCHQSSHRQRWRRRMAAAIRGRVLTWSGWIQEVSRNCVEIVGERPRFKSGIVDH